jgi:hypothetical protein
MRQKVLLIGNGPSVLNSKRGAEIDNFNGKIARVNDYKINGFEDFIGTRTDIFIVGELVAEEKLKQQYDCILLYQAYLDGGRGLRNLKKLSPHNTINFFPLQEKDTLKLLLGLKPNMHPRTGIIAIYWFITQYIDLYIYGFDFTSGDYFDEDIIYKLANLEYHNFSEEPGYIEFLIEQKKIKWF